MMMVAHQVLDQTVMKFRDNHFIVDDIYYEWLTTHQTWIQPMLYLKEDNLDEMWWADSGVMNWVNHEQALCHPECDNFFCIQPHAAYDGRSSP